MKLPQCGGNATPDLTALPSGIGLHHALPYPGPWNTHTFQHSGVTTTCNVATIIVILVSL